MQMLLLAFAMPLAIAALKSGLRGREVNETGIDSDAEWWPLNIFGGGGKSDGPYKQKLENRGDAQYFGVIEVGGQKMKAVIDTGSFELLVFGSNCTICGAAKDLYNSSKSKTGNTVDFEAVHSYGSGTCYSKKANDVLKIGKYSVTNQSFWEVYDADMYILSEGAFQAIFGVGPPSSAVRFAEDDDAQVHDEVKTMKKNGEKVTDSVKEIQNHYDDMVEYMKNTSSVSENLNLANMSVCLGQQSESPGYFLWDDHATRDYPEKFTTLDVVGDYYWSAALGTVHLAGGRAPAANASKKLQKLAQGTIDLGCKKGNCSAIVDTGTSLLVAPSAVVDALYDLADDWEAAGGTCDDISQLPEFRFTLNGIDFALPPEAYMGEVTGDVYGDLAKYMPRFYSKQVALKKKQQKALKQQQALKQPTDDWDGDSYGYDPDWSMCEPLIMSLDADSSFGEMWILGMPFFRKYYTTFHFIQKEGKTPEAAQMSFSEQDGKCNPGIPPQPIEDNTTSSKDATSFSGRLDAADATPRRAQLKIDAKSILVPSFVRNAHNTRKQKLLSSQPV